VPPLADFLADQFKRFGFHRSILRWSR
jgi:hypothetical protein